MTSSFQRARSEEQRTARRQAILDAAAAMLVEMPVAAVTLTELSRRSGLAKSNVLRYVESREAVLLELLGGEWEAWLDELGLDLPRAVDPAAGVAERGRQVAVAVAASLARRRVLGGLLAAQAAVLEHNVSPEVAARFKKGAAAATTRLAATVLGVVPELGERDALRLGSAVGLLTGALFTHATPSAAMLAAYAADPEVAAMRIDLATVLEELLVVVVAGLLATA